MINNQVIFFLCDVCVPSEVKNNINWILKYFQMIALLKQTPWIDINALF